MKKRSLGKTAPAKGNPMKEINTKAKWLIVIAIDYVYSLCLLAWFFAPVIFHYTNQVVFHDLPAVLATGRDSENVSLLAAVIAYAIPAISGIRLILPFLRKKLPALSDPERLIPVLTGIVHSLLPLSAVSLYVFAFARNPGFFATLSVFTYVGIGISLLYNAMYVVLFVKNLNRRSDTYREYLAYARETGRGRNGLVSFILRAGIQKKLIFSFIGLFMIVIAILTTILVLQFRQSIANSVVYNGITLAARYSDIIRANPAASDIEINDYLGVAVKNNPGSDLTFNFIAIYRKQGKQDVYVATNATSPDLLGKRLPAEYASMKEAGTARNADNKTIDCIAPAVLGGITIAYTVVEYAEEAIYASFFRTIVKIVAFILLFLYVTAVLVYVFGSKIVFPILFLGMSVNKISSNLSALMTGKERISSVRLEYDDRITTRDEIKDLSNEFKNMTSVIRGILPYVSVSTLKNADAETPTTSKRDLAFLFTDIRGFTSLCEGLDPAQVVRILNKYLDIQSSIILNYKGDIDKFVGDEIMAVFDGPKKELNACLASMDIREAMAKEKERDTQKNRTGISIGIGIHSGRVVFGSVGARERMDFTSIGDTVNLAARLESANKIYGTKALITDSVRAKLDGEFVLREIDTITVKGKTKPVSIYEILQRSYKADQKLTEIKELFEAGLEKYRERDWKEAAKLFKKNADKYDDSPSRVFLDRIRLFAINPPPRGWNGVFTSTVK